MSETDEDMAIVGYSQDIASDNSGNKEAAPEDDLKLSLTEKILNKNAGNDEEEEDSSFVATSKNITDEEKVNIEYWAKQDPDGKKKKAAEEANVQEKKKKAKEEEEKAVQ